MQTQETIGERLDFISKNKVNIMMESRHLPGGTEHNLICWMCEDKPAIYSMNPEWIFLPCRDCQKKYKGIWTNTKKWWQVWKQKGTMTKTIQPKTKRNEEIYKLISNGMSMRGVAETYNLSFQRISQIYKRQILVLDTRAKEE